MLEDYALSPTPPADQAELPRHDLKVQYEELLFLSHLKIDEFLAIGAGSESNYPPNIFLIRINILLGNQRE